MYLNDIKRILDKYRHDVKHSVNYKALKGFLNNKLEKCAEFLKLEVRTKDDAQTQLYPNKETLVDRIILKIESLFETKCEECESKYRNRLSDTEEPLLSCFLCYQGSHDCEIVKAKYEPLREYFADATGKLNGLNWLCWGCRKKNDLALTPKPKKTVVLPGDPTEPTENNEENDEPEIEHGDDEEEQTEEPEERSPRRDHPIPQRGDICPLYKKMQCPHGLTGKRHVDGAPCAKLHPKRCIRYCRSATDKKHGCIKGKECKYYHPILCRHSVKRHVCLDKNCKFTHLKGTKRYDPDLRVNQRSQQMPETPRAYVPLRNNFQQTPSAYPPMSRNPRPCEDTEPARTAEANGSDRSFLSKLPHILNQMQAKQADIQTQLMQLIRQQPPQWPHVPQQQEPQPILQQAPMLPQGHHVPLIMNAPPLPTQPWNLQPTLPSMY